MQLHHYNKYMTYKFLKNMTNFNLPVHSLLQPYLKDNRSNYKFTVYIKIAVNSSQLGALQIQETHFCSNLVLLNRVPAGKMCFVILGYFKQHTESVWMKDSGMMSQMN